MTAVKKVWLNPTKRVPISTQLKAAEAWGVTDRVYDMWDSSKGDRIEDVIAGMREGEWLGVYQAHLLAPGPNKRAGETSGMVFDRIALALVDAGIRIHELKTGLSCGNKRQLVRLMVEAKRTLAKNSGGNKGAKGRPPKLNLSDADLMWIIAVWDAKSYKNNADRVLAVKGRFPEFELQDWYRLKYRVEAMRKEEPSDA